MKQKKMFILKMWKMNKTRTPNEFLSLKKNLAGHKIDS